MINTIHDKPPFEPEKTVAYPFIGGCAKSGLVVLFTRRHCGTVLQLGTTTNYKLGEVSTNWDMGAFTALPEGESITLSNKWEIADE